MGIKPKLMVKAQDQEQGSHREHCSVPMLISPFHTLPVKHQQKYPQAFSVLYLALLQAG